MNTKLKKENDIRLKYVPKPLTSLTFFILLGFVFILFYGRKSESLQFDYLLQQMPHFYQHVSNFALSYMLYAGIGYFWLMMEVKFRYIILFGIALLVANLIYELFIPLLNTRDIVDAYFGFVGVILAFGFLFFTHRYGLTVTEKKLCVDSET